MIGFSLDEILGGEPTKLSPEDEAELSEALNMAADKMLAEEKKDDVAGPKDEDVLKPKD